MIETNFQKLMNRSADLLSDIKGGKSQFTEREEYTEFVSESGRPIPVRHYYKCFMVLVHEPDTFKTEPVIVSLYEPAAIPESPPVGATVIIHGHDQDSQCYANTYCHVLGYQGSTRHWMKKWNHIYATSASNQSNPEKASE